MIYDYLVKNYKYGDAIIESQLPCASVSYLRQELKKLNDTGKLERVFNGVYILPYTTILGTKGKLSISDFIQRKYLLENENIIGYITGLQLCNKLGFTTQNPACYEVCSNAATTKQRKLEVDGNRIIIYQPPTQINVDNSKELQFLDLMSCIDRYNELPRKEYIKKLRKYILESKLDFAKVKASLQYYPDRTYKNLYVGGVMNELV